jgi:hypothetical protein
MENFLVLDDKRIQLPSGVFAGVEKYSRYPDGELEGVRLSERNMLVTHAGELVPFYSETTRRKMKHSVGFYKSGAVRSVSLEEQQEILTPIGEFPAELATFYESGELKRFFPLDGKISGFWTEEEEQALAIPFTFDLPFSVFTAAISGVGFYKNGNIRSVTLFPKERVVINTQYGAIAARIGFSMHPGGELASLEPAGPAAVTTPVGRLYAFDADAIGVNADTNSLTFDTSGEVTGLKTVQNRVSVQTPGGQLVTFGPVTRVSPLDDDDTVTLALSVAFGPESVTLTESGSAARTFLLAECGFTVTDAAGPAGAYGCPPAACAACSLCAGGAEPAFEV